MAIQRWDPLREMLRLQEEVNRLFGEVLARSGASTATEAGGTSGWKPPMDIFEQSNRYVIRVDLPGVDSGNVDIAVEDGTLLVRGERIADPGVPRESYLRTERPSGRFALQINLPPSVNVDEIKARHGDGVLEISMPRKKEAGRSPVRVEVM